MTRDGTENGTDHPGTNAPAAAAARALATITAILAELDRTGRRVPASTLRLQLTAGFTFADAAAVVPVLAELGADTAYLSPVTQAAPGSTSGYDVIDYGQLNAELGGDEGFEMLVAALKAHDLGLLIDVVPNHMGGIPFTNPLWRDVLARGRDSAAAGRFDIDWEAPGLDGKVLAPELGGSLDQVLADGQLPFDISDGALVVRPYGDRSLPLDPATWDTVLGPAGVPADVTDGPRLAAALAADPELAKAVRAELDAWSSPDAAGRVRALLDRQHYVLDDWHRSFDDINYRRFFDVRELAGIRQEEPGMLATTHARVIAAALRLAPRAGLRIDHPGGLADPAGYLHGLQLAWLTAWARQLENPEDPAAFDREIERRAGEVPATPLYLLVESVLGLAEDERLPDDWPVAGDVGYGPLNLLTWLQLDADGARRIATEVWPAFAARSDGAPAPLEELSVVSKRGVAEGYTLADGRRVPAALHPDAMLIARRLGGLPGAPELDVEALRAAVVAVAAHLPVYRTYTPADGRLPADQARWLAHALSGAKGELGGDPALAWVERVLTGVDPSPAELGVRRRFEQFSAPLMAKGFEDRLLYVHVPNPALNEVGGDPAAAGLDPAGWHETVRARLGDQPHALHPTATHDTKRGADTRARLAALTAVPDAWAAFLDRAWDMLESYRTDVDGGRAPSANELYLLLATMAGTLPAEELSAEGPAPKEWAERLGAYMDKALREGKVSTSWVTEDRGWEAATRELAARAAADPDFMAVLRSFVAGNVAVPGMLAGLASVVLSAAVFVPDVYQRTLTWDLDLVDPDNRRPVDWDRIRHDLSDLGAAPDPAALLGTWPDGRLKLWVLRQVLHLRRDHPVLFDQGAYLPLGPGGPDAVTVGVARVLGDEAVVLLVPRLPGRVAGPGTVPVGAAWGDRTAELPPGLPAGSYVDRLTGASVDLDPARPAHLNELLASLPLAILEYRPGAHR
jgi:malto-oligosyltrehalose synthase